jgi:hypothetical protein
LPGTHLAISFFYEKPKTLFDLINYGKKLKCSQNNLLLLKEMLLVTNMWIKKEFLEEMTTKMP